LLAEELRDLKARTVEEFCAVMEFKAFTDLAYQMGSDYAKKLPDKKNFRIQYSEFAHRVGLPDKDVTPPDLPGYFQRFRDPLLFELIHQKQVATFEALLFDAMRALLLDEPRRLPKGRKIDYSAVIEAASRDEVISSLVDRELNELTNETIKKTTHACCGAI